MKNSLTIIILLLLFASCEKVIDVDLNDAAPEIVIEANLSNSTNMGEVFLSKTGSYFGESSIGKISDALVTVEDEFGNRFDFEEVEAGYYKTEKIIIEDEISYRLSVDVEGKKYESVSKLNPVVVMDSLAFFYDDGFAFLDGGYIVKVYFVDPPDQKNYYRIKIFENDTLVNEADELILFDDRLINGQTLEVALQGFLFEPEDTIAVQLISLDEGAYEYYKTFQELTNVNPGSAAPANPTSNISNNALGFFSAWSADVKWLIIKELD